MIKNVCRKNDHTLHEKSELLFLCLYTGNLFTFMLRRATLLAQKVICVFRSNDVIEQNKPIYCPFDQIPVNNRSIAEGERMFIFLLRERGERERDFVFN